MTAGICKLHIIVIIKLCTHACTLCLHDWYAPMHLFLLRYQISSSYTEKASEPIFGGLRVAKIKGKVQLVQITNLGCFNP